MLHKMTIHKMTAGPGGVSVERLVGQKSVRLDRLAAMTFWEHSDGPWTVGAVGDLPKAALEMLRAEYDIAPPA
jgi:hypothetical protein